MYDIFKKFDKNNNFQIEIDEFVSVVLGEQYSASDYKDFIRLFRKEIDVDNDREMIETFEIIRGKKNS